MIPAWNVGVPKAIDDAIRSKAPIASANRPARLQPGRFPRCPSLGSVWTMVEWA